MEVKGKFSFDCNRCGKSYEYTSEDVDFVKTEMDGDNQWYVWEKDFNCFKCGNSISIKYEVALTPDGKVADKKVNVGGAKETGDSFIFSI